MSGQKIFRYGSKACRQQNSMVTHHCQARQSVNDNSPPKATEAASFPIPYIPLTGSASPIKGIRGEFLKLDRQDCAWYTKVRNCYRYNSYNQVIAVSYWLVFIPSTAPLYGFSRYSLPDSNLSTSQLDHQFLNQEQQLVGVPRSSGILSTTHFIICQTNLLNQGRRR
jgi:hypothetical protein